MGQASFKARLDRYAPCWENFVLVAFGVRSHDCALSGRDASRPPKAATRRTHSKITPNRLAMPGYQGRSPWLVRVYAHAREQSSRIQSLDLPEAYYAESYSNLRYSWSSARSWSEHFDEPGYSFPKANSRLMSSMRFSTKVVWFSSLKT